MGFKEFKKAQAKQDEAKIVEQDQQTKSFKDYRFWNITKDASGNAKAIVRFLPQKDAEKSPFVKTFQHSFQNKKTKRWFIDDCPWTIKVPCPVCKYASEIYSQDSGPSKKTYYIANILIVKDEMNPEAEGKVFLYKFGKEIFKKIQEAVAGKEEQNDELETITIDPIKVFNMFEGHNFSFIVSEKSIAGYDKPVNDYKNCKFSQKQTEICGGDETKQEAVYNSLYNLDEFLDPKRFKTEEELSKKLASVLTGEYIKPEERVETPEKKKVADKKESITDHVSKEDDDDDFFASLDDDDDLPF